MNARTFAVVLSMLLGAVSLAGEIPAEQRDAFDSWVDARMAKLAQHRAGKAILSARERQQIEDELEQADVDVESFLVAGEKNFDFPKMLYFNEFYQIPKERLNPKNWSKKIHHIETQASNARAGTTTIASSSFFTNVEIESYTPERLVAEITSFQPQGAVTITKVKEGGTSEGIWIKDEQGQKFIVIFDPPFAPEMTTSAEFIGSTLARLVGYQVPKTMIYRVQGTGNAMYDGRRAVATRALKDFKGGWRHQSFRDRRELRGLIVLAAWLGNVDQTEQNSGLTTSDAGVHRHYVLDFGASLGSFTFRPQPARLGWTKLFDPYNQFTQPLYDHGIRKVAWEAPYRVKSASVGYFTSNFDPDRWQPFYANLGFAETTREDRVWMAKRIARVSDEQIRAVVSLADYSHPSDQEHVIATLIARRDIIVNRYLSGRCRD